MLVTRLDRKTFARRQAFTLMEVLVVAAIILMLAGAATWGYMRYLEQGKESAAHMTIQHIAQAVEIYKSEMGEYPPDLDTLCQPMGSRPAALEKKDEKDPWNQDYIYEPQNLHPQTFKCKVSSTHLDSKTGQPISNW